MELLRVEEVFGLAFVFGLIAGVLNVYRTAGKFLK